MQALNTTSLGRLTRPGAWLLDYVYTAIGVIYGDTKPSVTYTAVLNATHRELLELCFLDVARTSHASSNNNRGNQMEALCWILLEANLPELILAQAYHCYRRTRAAKLAEAGASVPHSAAGQSTVQRQAQALIQFARQHDYFFAPPDARSAAPRTAQEQRHPHPATRATASPAVGPRSHSSQLPPGAFGPHHSLQHAPQQPTWHAGPPSRSE